MGELAERTRAWRRQRSWLLLREGAARLLCAGLCALTVLLWLDAVFLLSRPAREALGAAAVLAFAAGWVFVLRRPWRTDAWPAVIEAAAAEHPSLRPYLGSAWDLSRARPRHASRRLAQAHLEATEALLAGLPPRPVFRWVPSRPLRLLAVLGLAGALSWPWLGRASWERVLTPWRDVALERFVVLEPGDCVWTAGQPAAITARLVAGGGPAAAGDVQLWLKASDSWRRAAWERREERRAVLSVPAVVEPLWYRATWRGLASRSYRL
ncbi:MAG: hypothetical protein PHF00_04855, partial [Elusimicrobia bacterium]|nr:hypothetical protein [Elusimicrobiota bacterium]